MRIGHTGLLCLALAMSCGGDDEGETSLLDTTEGCVDPGGERTSEDVTLTTTDGKSIAATVNAPSEGTCLPALLLIHQFSNDRSQWEAMQDTIVGRGYVTLAIDLRGHGESDPQDGDFGGLLEDPNQAPVDVAAAVEFLVGHQAVDANRIGAIGTSIGANLTVVAMTGGNGVEAIAPVSPRLSAIESLAGNPASLAVDDVFCFAGALDSSGAQADTCNELVAVATGDARAEIIPDSSAHGTAILSGFPDALPAILDWTDQVL